MFVLRSSSCLVVLLKVMLLKALLVQLMAAMIWIALPATLQSSESLRQKYGLPDAARFAVRPGIVLTVAFAKDGRPCEMLIEPRHSVFINRGSFQIDALR